MYYACREWRFMPVYYVCHEWEWCFMPVYYVCREWGFMPVYSVCREWGFMPVYYVCREWDFMPVYIRLNVNFIQFIFTVSIQILEKKYANVDPLKLLMNNLVI